MSEGLTVWLSQEIARRGWSHTELAKKASVSRPLVSRILSGDMPASADFCIKVAQALGESPEKVLRLAGILPAAPPATPTDDSILQELVELARNLPSKDRKELLKYARFRYQQREEDE